MTRVTLPTRRPALTFRFAHTSATGSQHEYLATAGFYDDGRVGEVFIASDVRVGSDVDTATKDAAIAVSIALQYGCPIDVLLHAFLLDANGRPESAAGSLLRALDEELRAVGLVAPVPA